MNTTETINTTAKMLQLIKEYRNMERSSYTVANNVIKVVCELCERQNLTNHLANSWRSKEENFADWYLNLDQEFMYYILASFNVLSYRDTDSEEAEYLTLLEADPVEATFLPLPGLLEHSRKLLLFFNNNAIEADAIPGITLPKIPMLSKNKYGNSANWGDYILSLPSSDQDTIIQNIINQK